MLGIAKLVIRLINSVNINYILLEYTILKRNEFCFFTAPDECIIRGGIQYPQHFYIFS